MQNPQTCFMRMTEDLLSTAASGHMARGVTRRLVEAATPRTASLKVAGATDWGAEGGGGAKAVLYQLSYAPIF